MDSEEVSLPWIHDHPMMPWNDLRKGDCCKRFDSVTDGYYCKSCDIFIHKKCGDKPSETIIQHQSHPVHPLMLKTSKGSNKCDVCGRGIKNHMYRCEICDFDIDLCCARYTPPDVIDVPEMHHHKLTLFKKRIDFVCDAKCGKIGYNEFPYKCEECDITFHINCVWSPPEVKHMLEVNHSYHPRHSLKLVKGSLPDYSDGKCRLCGRKVDELFYHCFSCNFTLDMCCVLNPPPQSVMDLKAHEHQLTLLPRLDSFTCNACGVKGDRSPYICVPCDFIIHQKCLSLPRLIKINRHHHRISFTSILSEMNSVCGVCRQKVDWTCGGYSCQRCPGYVVHSKCATRKDVWDGKELEGVPEEIEDLEPYVVMDDNKIHHFSHKEHYLRLYVNGIIYEEDKRCNACTRPISLHQSFYGCMDCDFILHQNCAELPKKKWHVLHSEQLILVTENDNYFYCDACDDISTGFMYEHGLSRFDVLCSSISELFFHVSHCHHPLFHISGEKLCNGCKLVKRRVLMCFEDGCEFTMCFKCATLPQEVMHIVDDHPLSLCYGEKVNGKYWCDICEEESNLETWFYTFKDQRTGLHVKCVLGDFSKLMPKTTIEYWGNLYEIVLNNGIFRPFCKSCKFHCLYPIILMKLGISSSYVCSMRCAFEYWQNEILLTYAKETKKKETD